MCAASEKTEKKGGSRDGKEHLRKRWIKAFEASDEGNKGYLSREDYKVAVVMLFGYKPSKKVVMVTNLDDFKKGLGKFMEEKLAIASNLAGCVLPLFSEAACLHTPVTKELEQAELSLVSCFRDPVGSREAYFDHLHVYYNTTGKRADNATLMVEVDSIMASVMQSQPGLSLEKFLNVMSTKKAARFYHNEVRQLFTAFDRQCKGFLSFEDFKKAFNIVAPKLPERIIIEAFR
ncbi:EF-hand calcium-binding domain-containing protein 11 [Varanus komodoensis]|nr:EF-hand calcium-binding domain-containing protein 11 [Varanus komodoensis]